MTIAVGATLAQRDLALLVAEAIRQIEDDMTYYAAQRREWKDNKPAHWRMEPLARERLVELRLRMERIVID